MFLYEKNDGVIKKGVKSQFKQHLNCHLKHSWMSVAFYGLYRGVVRLWCCIFNGLKRWGWSLKALKYIFIWYTERQTLCHHRAAFIDFLDVQYVTSLYLITLTCSALQNSVFELCVVQLCLFFPIYLVVEEVLVCFDGSQPEILQGFNCRGGKLICSMLILIACLCCTVLLVFFHVCGVSHLCVTSGLWPGWWDWPVYLLQCNWIPSSTQLWFPNTCKMNVFTSNVHLFRHLY